MKTTIISLKDLTQKEIKNTFEKGLPIPFPTETVFGLGAPFDDFNVIENVFELKGRPQDNPLIVHISRKDMLEKIAYVSEDASRLMDTFFPGPLTLVLKKQEAVSSVVTAGKETVAVRMPSHPVALTLIDSIGKPMVAPSANLSGKPSATEAKHVYDDFNGHIPFIIEGEATSIGIESTIVDMTQKPYTILRPGYISKADLERVLGPVFDGESQVVAPGMIHPHYEPTHPLYILQGSDEAIINFMKKKDHAVFIGHHRFQSKIKSMISMGHNDNEMMQSLYKILRETNHLNIQDIYTHEIHHVAYMNRLMKAAKGKVIPLKDSPDTPSHVLSKTL